MPDKDHRAAETVKLAYDVVQRICTGLIDPLFHLDLLRLPSIRPRNDLGRHGRAQGWRGNNSCYPWMPPTQVRGKQPRVFDALRSQRSVEITPVKVCRGGLCVTDNDQCVHVGAYCVRTVKNRTTVTAAAAT